MSAEFPRRFGILPAFVLILSTGLAVGGENTESTSGTAEARTHWGEAQNFAWLSIGSRTALEIWAELLQNADFFQNDPDFSFSTLAGIQVAGRVIPLRTGR